MRTSLILAALCSSGLWATTLQVLTTDQMIEQSTAIVHVKVSGSSAVLHGRNIYTVYQLSVIETLKAGPNALSSVSIPGGTLGGIRQMVAGAPALITGQEYVIFLWTSPSGLTQIIGLSQGLFSVVNSAGSPVLVRPSTAAMIVNQNGAPIPASAVSMTLAGLKTEIQKVLG
jgi:hypothetical protein